MSRRRALHFVPGNQARMLEKALGLPADGLILDLEDAVPPDEKAATRAVVRDWLGRDWSGRERWVRMNPLATGLGRADLEETIAGRPHGYVVPKPRGPADVRAVGEILDSLEQRHGTISSLLAAMQRMGRNPPPVMITRPGAGTRIPVGRSVPAPSPANDHRHRRFPAPSRTKVVTS